MKEFVVDDKTAKKYRRKSLIAFIIFFALLALGWTGWKYLNNAPRDGGIRGGLQKPLRQVLDLNEEVYSGLFSSKRLVKEYPRSKAAPRARVNGDVGLDPSLFDSASWRLQILRANGDTLSLTLDDIKQLPRYDVVFNFKCIEGWSQITWWSGARFSDLIKKYHLEKEAGMKYVGMATPDEEYYVGIDMPSIMQPQTILCYQLNAQPLPMNQGYPLRLIIPVKYGVKHLKRIGTISFSNTRPPDYWAERGYDYYTGL
ncbi:MAG: molybdopterin-dependent oxidoreductase [Chitinophagaceae bacterium]|nr:molybdopterin-dependent oxidoreductase [Chitinophagaceae bacterium]